MKKINIGFSFRGNHYDAVIRVRQKAEGREYLVTVLDWNLERVLYGNHIIDEKEGSIEANVSFNNREQTELKLIIASRLSKYLKMPCFAGDQCVGVDYVEEGWEDFHPIPGHIDHRIY